MRALKLSVLIITVVSVCLLLSYYYASEVNIPRFTFHTDVKNISESKILYINAEIDHRTNTVCQTNDALCTLLSQPICKYLIPHPVFRLHHHKTGYKLSQKLRLHILRFCNPERYVLYTKNSTFRSELKHIFIKEIHVEPQQLNDTLYRSDFTHSVFFHFMRPPIDTILSGFYYHAKSREFWLLKPIYEARTGHYRIQNIDLFNDLISSQVDDTHYYHKYLRAASNNVSTCFKLPNMNKALNHFYMDTIINTSEYQLMPYDTIHSFYRLMVTEHVDIGLFWEFVRYFNCEWAAQYLMHAIGSKHVDHYHRLDMNVFMTNMGFESNINRIMDALNIVASEDNVATLRRYDSNYSAEYIVAQRQRLAFMLREEDLSAENGFSVRGKHSILRRSKHIHFRRPKLNFRQNNSNLTHRRLWRSNIFPGMQHNEHITQGTFDKAKSVELLLTLNLSICETIKNMTLWMDFEWIYSEFC